MEDTLEEQTNRALQQLEQLQDRLAQHPSPAENLPPQTDPPPAPAPQSGQSLLRFLHLDNDTLLILPLVLLLAREGADDTLLLALLYLLL